LDWQQRNGYLLSIAHTARMRKLRYRKNWEHCSRPQLLKNKGRIFGIPCASQKVMDTSYRSLMYEYRLVQTIWREANALEGPDGKEVIAAAIRMEELKRELEERRAAIAA